MLYVVTGRDADGAAALRREHLEAHLAWVLASMDRIRVAGPLREAPDGEPCMSLYVLEAGSEAEVRAFLSGDPYFRAGVWSALEIHPFVAAAGTWVGGAAWTRRG